MLKKWRLAEAAIADVVPDASVKDAWQGGLLGSHDASGVDSGDESADGVTGSTKGNHTSSSQTSVGPGSNVTGRRGVKGAGISGASARGWQQQSVKFGPVDTMGKRVVVTGEPFNRLVDQWKEHKEKQLCVDRLVEFRVMMERKFRGRVQEHHMLEEVMEVSGPWGHVGHGMSIASACQATVVTKCLGSAHFRPLLHGTCKRNFEGGLFGEGKEEWVAVRVYSRAAC